MEVGCLRHPGASTISSQLLDEDCSHGWQILATQPWVPTQYEEHAPVTLLKQWKEGGKGDGRGTAWAMSCRHRIGRKMPPVRTSRYDPQTRGIPMHAHTCRHGWLLGEHKRSLLLTVKLHLTAFNAATSRATSMANGYILKSQPVQSFVILPH